jgi:hypothetical protein
VGLRFPETGERGDELDAFRLPRGRWLQVNGGGYLIRVEDTWDGTHAARPRGLNSAAACVLPARNNALHVFFRKTNNAWTIIFFTPIFHAHVPYSSNHVLATSRLRLTKCLISSLSRDLSFNQRMINLRFIERNE